jgi:hypothetical protein
VQECHRHLATRAKEVLAQCLEYGNDHESHRNMGAGTQAHGMTASQAPGHGHPGTMAARAQGRGERQGHDQERQDPRH